MKYLACSLVSFSLVLLSGCEYSASAGVSVEHREEAPHQLVGGGGGVTNTIRAEAGIKGCSSGHPDCQKPTKSEIEQKMRNFNMVLQQTNTYSTPVNQKILIEVLDAGNSVVSQVFDSVVVGNQIRIAHPSHAADWLYYAMDRGTTLQTSVFLQSTGFGSEVVTAQIRDGGTVIAAESFIVEIDCGTGHPWGEPEQGCVLVP